jgi:hypothetical protein
MPSVMGKQWVSNAPNEELLFYIISVCYAFTHFPVFSPEIIFGKSKLITAEIIASQESSLPSKILHLPHIDLALRTYDDPKKYKNRTQITESTGSAGFNICNKKIKKSA